MAGPAAARVGIVGVGRMGLAILGHLVTKGFSVTACDIDGRQCERARAAGGLVAGSPRELGALCDFVILAVGFHKDVERVMADGLADALPPESIVAVSSTVSPDQVRSLAAVLALRGVHVLDAPLCRGRWAADAGTLLALFGGTEPVVARAEPIYRAFCSDTIHLGPVGHGQAGKAINNLLLWINAVGLIEAGRLAASAGLDLPKLREALLISTGGSDALDGWDQISFTWALKDMQVVAEMTDQAGLALPLAGAVRELVKEARRVKAEAPPPWTGRKTDRP